MSTRERTILVADVGGTNVRFAIGRRMEDEPCCLRLTAPRAFPGDDFLTLEDAIREYMGAAGGRADAVVLSLAGPVNGETVRLTNRDWEITTDGAAEAAGAGRALLINDFAAAAMSLPYLEAKDLIHLGGPARAPDLWTRPDLRVSALGPGTGLGHALLIRSEGIMRPLDTEAGHISFAAWDEETWAVVQTVSQRYGRCTLEHLASGPGLSHIYAAISGHPWEERPKPAELERLAAGGDVAAARALTLFCEILGAGSGDLAMAAGARHGVFIMGGVAAALSGRLQAGGFRARFEAKGDFAPYVRAIPTVLAAGRHTGLIGAAAALEPDLTEITVEED